MFKKCLCFFLLLCLLLPMTQLTASAAHELPPTISWPIGQVMPSFPPPADVLDAVETRPLSFHDRCTMAVLQGLVNREKPVLFLLGEADGHDEGAETWPQDLNLQYEINGDWMDAILRYRSFVKGLVVFNPDIPATLNVATTLAGLKDYLAVTPALAQTLAAAPYNMTVAEDLRDAPIKSHLEAYQYIYDHYWSQCSRRGIFGLSPDTHHGLRSLAVSVRGACLWLDSASKEDAPLLRKFFRDATPIDTFLLGYWPNEGDGIGFSSRRGIMTVPADHFQNYSVYAGMDRTVTVPPVPAKPALQNGKIYVSLNYSDGDNIQYQQHAMRHAELLWNNPDRGKVPIGWTSSPILLDAAPQMMNYFYRTATPNDVFICGPSGAGYSAAGNWGGRRMINRYGELTNSYFERTGLNIITVWGWMVGPLANAYSKKIPSLLGMTMQDRVFSRIYHTSTNAPVVWFGSDLPEGVPMGYEFGTESTLHNLRLAAKHAKEDEPAFYAAQFVSWETSVTELAQLAETIESEYPGLFEFVRTDHMMMLVNESSGKPFQASLQQTVTASSNAADAANAVDDTFSTGWQADAAGEQWLQIDLGEELKLERYVLKNASTNGADAQENTRAWQIQVSKNGTDGWKTIDTVKENDKAIAYRKLPKTDARYVRILVTNPGENAAKIQEFAVYASRESARPTPSSWLQSIPEKLGKFWGNFKAMVLIFPYILFSILNALRLLIYF